MKFSDVMEFDPVLKDISADNLDIIDEDLDHMGYRVNQPFNICNVHSTQVW